MRPDFSIFCCFTVLVVSLVFSVNVGMTQTLDTPLAQNTDSHAIGGEFELVDSKGNTFTDKDLLGTYSLIYFGYTFCPDVCPTDLVTMTSALKMIPTKQSNEVVPIFITLDPARDTPEVMGEYVKYFHDRLVGLSGTTKQVHKAAKAYRVYYKKTSEVDDRRDNYYLLDHSAFVYLMDPDGDYVIHFSHGISAQELADQLKAYVR